MIKDRIKELRRVRAGDLTPHPENWRRHPKNQVTAMRSALEEIGYADAILVREHNGGLQIIDGHLRAGLDPDQEVPVLVVDLTDDETLKLLATHDPIAALAETDADTLQNILGSIEFQNDELAQTILDAAGIRGPVDPKDGLTDPDELPGGGKGRTEKGDLWTLGNHRLLCGDSTLKKNMKRLCAGSLATVVFTDPPYGVAYESGRFEMIEGDDKQRDALAQMISKAVGAAAQFTDEKGAFYIWHASGNYGDVRYAIEAAGLDEIQTIIWAKPSFTLTNANYQWGHEVCLYAAKAGSHPVWHGDRKQSTLWRIEHSTAKGLATIIGPGVILTDGEGNEVLITTKIPKSKKIRTLRVPDCKPVLLERMGGSSTLWEVARDKDTEHPTQKPVELVIRALTNSSQAGDIVLDPFMGSGTTIIGAEQLERRAFGIEIDPYYCDVAVRRWEKFTGKKAKKEKSI